VSPKCSLSPHQPRDQGSGWVRKRPGSEPSVHTVSPAVSPRDPLRPGGRGPPPPSAGTRTVRGGTSDQCRSGGHLMCAHARVRAPQVREQLRSVNSARLASEVSASVQIPRRTWSAACLGIARPRDASKSSSLIGSSRVIFERWDAELRKRQASADVSFGTRVRLSLCSVGVLLAVGRRPPRAPWINGNDRESLLSPGLRATGSYVRHLFRDS
jgi:hypothetical protein